MASRSRTETTPRAAAAISAGVAGLKTPDMVLADVRRRLDRTWPDAVLAELGWHEPATALPPGTAPAAETMTTGRPEHAAQPTSATPAWPHDFPLGQPTAERLAAAFSDIAALVRDWWDWAQTHDMVLTWRRRRVQSTDQQLPTHLVVNDLTSAARLTRWERELDVARRRARVLLDRYPTLATPSAVLRQVLTYHDEDFTLLCHTADWFAARAAAGPPQLLTARQVPIEGIHAKWLNTRHALIASLAGVDDLGLLPAHPPRLHFTYLDPDHLAAGGRRHDCATVGDQWTLPYTPDVVIISENKDTAIHFPPLPAGIAVEGSGRGGTTAAAFKWITQAPAVFYWGDMDPDGFEILDEFRAAGVPAHSLLMDAAAYSQWERFGTHVDQRGAPLQPRSPRPTPHLTAAERALYHDLCSPNWTRHRRIEQERIPLHVAHAAVMAALD